MSERTSIFNTRIHRHLCYMPTFLETTGECILETIGECIFSEKWENSEKRKL